MIVLDLASITSVNAEQQPSCCSCCDRSYAIVAQCSDGRTVQLSPAHDLKGVSLNSLVVDLVVDKYILKKSRAIPEADKVCLRKYFVFLFD